MRCFVVACPESRGIMLVQVRIEKVGSVLDINRRNREYNKTTRAYATEGISGLELRRSWMRSHFRFAFIVFLRQRFLRAERTKQQ